MQRNLVFKLEIYLFTNMNHQADSTKRSNQTEVLKHPYFLMGGKSRCDSPLCMDSLAALNVVPFLGLMNLLEVKYLQMPEIYRTALAILCDYNPLSQENIVKTRHYLSVLLAREPELAQCLLNFIDTPEESAQSPSEASIPGRQADSSEENHGKKESQEDSHGANTSFKYHKLACGQDTNCSAVTSSKQQNDSSNNSSASGFEASRDEPSSPNIQPSTEATRCTDQETFNKSTDVSSPNTSGCVSPIGIRKLHNLCVRAPRSVPVINIHNRGSAMPQAAILSGTCSQVLQPHGVPLFLPHVLSSHKAPGCDQTVSSSCGGRSMSDTHTCTALLSYLHADNQLPAKSDSFASSHIVNSLTVKSSKKWKPAQTQTCTVLASDSTTLLTANTAGRMAPSIKESNTMFAALPASKESWCSPVTSKSHPSHPSTSINTPSVCLSKLLGQPSVAYLPAGHFIDNRNCIVGGCKTAAAEKFSNNTAMQGEKLSSAAAKLRLLSTQAGSDKIQSFQTANRKAVSTPGPAKLIKQDRQTKTTVKLMSRAGGCNKWITLSSVLPLPSSDLAHANVRKETLGSDKQLQIGPQHISKRCKAAVGQREASNLPPEITSSAKQVVINQMSQSFFSNNENDDETLSVAQKLSPPNQPVNEIFVESKESGENLPDPAIPKHVQRLSISHLKAQRLRKMPVIKHELCTRNISPDGQKQAHDDQQIKTELSISQDENQDSQSQPQCTSESKIISDYDKENETPPPTTIYEKHMPLRRKATTIKSIVSRQKVQVVEVSVGASPSLSTFPYIQQMIFPNSQIPISENSTTSQAMPGTSQLKPTQADIMGSIKPSRIFPNSNNDKGGRCTTQIVLPKNQVKMSVSVQTPTSKIMTSMKKERQAFCHQTATEECPEFAASMLLHKSKEETTQTQQAIDLEMEMETFDTSQPGTSMGVIQGKTKRKRSHPRGSKTVSSKACKL